MDGGAWQAPVRGVTKNRTQLSHEHFGKKESEVTQSCLTLCDPWTVVGQAPLSMGYPRQEYWSGFPFPSAGELPDPGIKPGSPALQADSLPSELPGNPFCFLNMNTLTLH